MKTPTAAVTLAATNLANAGYYLAEAVREALTDEQRARFEALELSGCQIAVTMQWRADRCEVRLGFLADDSAPQTVLALNFPRPVPTHD